MANQHQVARNTVYAQKDKALTAVNDAFNVNDNEVLFYLPITKAVIAQMIVGLYLICKASYRDIIYWFACHLDFPVSLGHINTVLDEANLNAITLNENYDLIPIKQAASDEIFHQGKPIMATVDIESRYCAGLNKYDQRCGTSWGVELLQLQDQGFVPNYAVIDGAKGLRAGYEEALPSCLLLFDHFHIDKDANDLLRHLKNKRDSLLTTAVKLAD